MRPAVHTPSDGYLPRIADGLLADLLERSGAVCIKGPKWCGKTATAGRVAASTVFLQDPDRSPDLLELASLKPSALLDGEEPVLIDEWQMAPQLWDAVRFAVDRGSGRGRFILTGSATPGRTELPAHTGVGRIATLDMRTMSLYETGESTGEVSLAALFDGASAGASAADGAPDAGSAPEVAAVTSVDVDDVAFLACRGGWPEAVCETDEAIALAMARDYVTELLEADIEAMDGIRRNKTWMRSLMRSLARNTSTQASLATVAADMAGEPPSTDTLADYADALRRAWVTEDLEAWNPRLRSKTAVRTSPTRHFADPSIAAAMLSATPEKLLGDFETFGLLFESLVVHDLRVYAQGLGGEVRHYRDKTGLESDAVVICGDGRWAPIEVKLGARRIDEAARHLVKLADRVDCDREGVPSFLMVVTATQTAYRRADGVIVAPLAVLGP